MSGVRGAVLQSVLECIYSGEVQVENEEIEAFMKLSNELEVFGLIADVVNEDIQVSKMVCNYWIRDTA